jgi:hypothetical protein
VKIDLAFSLVKSEMLVALHFLVAARVFLPCVMYKNSEIVIIEMHLIHYVFYVDFLKK